MTLFLGLDVGTQGTKALLLDGESGEVLARAGVGYGLIEGLPPGAAEQHPDTWVAAVREATARVLDAAERAGRGAARGGPAPGAASGAARSVASGSSRAEIAGRVAGVGVSGQQHGLVVLDERGDVLRAAKLWCDTSTAEEAAELSAALGRPLPTGFTASKLLWLARHEPHTWARVRRVLLPHDHVNFVLTGRATMEAGDASGTGWFDPVTRTWDARALETFDALIAGPAAGAMDAVRSNTPHLADLLPPLLAPGESAGDLSATGAALLGLRAGIPVAAGSGDNMCSAVGSGATAPGVVVASLGTSGTVFTYSARPIADPDGLIAPFCDATGGWLPLLCVMNCTGVAEEVVALTGADHATLTSEAERVPAGCGGVLWLPFLQGERVPDLPRATASLHGLRAGSLRPGLLFRAALEGASLNLGAGVARLRALGVDVRSVRLVGGGARNALWRQILADVLDAPVTPLAEPESAALGAALLAQATAGFAERGVAALRGAARAGAARSAAPSVHELAARAVRPGTEVSAPDPLRVATYREAAGRFAALVAQAS